MTTQEGGCDTANANGRACSQAVWQGRHGPPKSRVPKESQFPLETLWTGLCQSNLIVKKYYAISHGHMQKKPPVGPPIAKHGDWGPLKPGAKYNRKAQSRG